jgi:Protein of unknown function (DUF2752)
MFVRRRNLYGLLALICVAGYVWMTLNIDRRFETHVGTVCVFKKATTLPCPSCGSTRSMKAILQGDFAAGFSWNPIGYLLLAALAILPWWILYDVLLNRQSLLRVYRHTEQLMLKPVIMWPGLLMVMANWIWNIVKGV